MSPRRKPRGPQVHQPNPNVNRRDRRKILMRRIRNLERPTGIRTLPGGRARRREKKLADYRNELAARP